MSFTLVALGQIVVAAVVNQADAANIDGLLAYADFAPAYVNVGVAECGQNLGHRNAVGFQLVRVHLDLKLLGGASPTVDGRDTRDGQQPARDDPILNGAEIGDSKMRRPDNLIAVNFPRRTVRLDVGHLVARQVDILRDCHRRLAISEEIIHAVLEADADKRQAVERSGADDLNAGSGVEADLHGARVITLHLLGGQARRLRGDFQDHRGRVRIGLDVEQLESDEPGAGKQQQSHDDNRAPA